VEILPKDRVDDYLFLEPEINEHLYLRNKKIYIPQFPGGKKLSHSEGTIDSINGYEFSYTASTKKGSSGSPILLKNSIKDIGIHKEGDKFKLSRNYGNLIYPIFNKLNYKRKNEFNDYNDNNYYHPKINYMINNRNSVGSGMEIPKINFTKSQNNNFINDCDRQRSNMTPMLYSPKPLNFNIINDANSVDTGAQNPIFNLRNNQYNNFDRQRANVTPMLYSPNPLNFNGINNTNSVDTGDQNPIFSNLINNNQYNNYDDQRSNMTPLMYYPPRPLNFNGINDTNSVDTGDQNPIFNLINNNQYNNYDDQRSNMTHNMYYPPKPLNFNGVNDTNSECSSGLENPIFKIMMNQAINNNFD
jgi:hypothetical protein